MVEENSLSVGVGSEIGKSVHLVEGSTVPKMIERAGTAQEGSGGLCLGLCRTGCGAHINASSKQCPKSQIKEQRHLGSLAPLLFLELFDRTAS